MQAPFESPFLFTVVQAGTEQALKAELAREMPRLRLAFSRPGFVTFKDSEKGASPLDPTRALPSVFARTWGVSCGKTAKPVDEVPQFARDLAQVSGAKKLRLHVWERLEYLPGDEPPGYLARQEADPVERSLRDGSPELFFDEVKAEPGDFVLDVVRVDSGDWWIGWHQHGPERVPFPGGSFPVALDSQAPSRAFLKLEELISWSGASVQAGDTAVELGSAPGGASYALLKRGLRVTGVDPGAMSEIVAKHPHFTHVPKAVNSLQPRDLPSAAQWLLLDMNVAPRASLMAVDKLMPLWKDSLLGLLLTLKMNDPGVIEEIPVYLDRIRSLGLSKLRALQLSHQRQELAVFGLTRKGATRLRGRE